MATDLLSASDIPALPSVELKAHAADLFNIDAALTEEERAIRDTIRKFRPAYERHLKSLHFAPGFDLDAELSIARGLTGRDDAGAHLETLP